MKKLTVAQLAIILAQARVKFGNHPLTGEIIDFIVEEVSKL